MLAVIFFDLELAFDDQMPENPLRIQPNIRQLMVNGLGQIK